MTTGEVEQIDQLFDDGFLQHVVRQNRRNTYERRPDGTLEPTAETLRVFNVDWIGAEDGKEVIRVVSRNHQLRAWAHVQVGNSWFGLAVEGRRAWHATMSAVTSDGETQARFSYFP
jgi:hypothetical protein